MSLAEIKERALGLGDGEQRELIAFLMAHRASHQEELQEAWARKIDDGDPANWIELDTLKQQLQG